MSSYSISLLLVRPKMKMTSKSLRDRTLKFVTCAIAVSAVAVAVVQGYSIWASVRSMSSNESTSNPFSFSSWRTTKDGCLLKDPFAERPTSPSTLHARFDEPALLDADADPIEFVSEDAIELDGERFGSSKPRAAYR